MNIFSFSNKIFFFDDKTIAAAPVMLLRMWPVTAKQCRDDAKHRLLSLTSKFHLQGTEWSSCYG